MGWIFEVAKMFLYISFPVGMFHYVNQPVFFDKWVTKAKEEHYPPQNKQLTQQMEEFIHDFNANIEKQHLDALEKQKEISSEENIL